MTTKISIGLLVLPVFALLLGCASSEKPPATLVQMEGQSQPRANIAVDEPRDGVTLLPGIPITASTYITPKEYVIQKKCPDAAIVISGDDIVVDFQGATLVGALKKTPADEYSGIGLKIKGKNVTVRNLNIRGYKTGIFATNCDGLIIEDVDLSRNYRQYLKSNPKVEYPGDWLKPHANDNKEWGKNYGAGIYIADASNVTIRRAFVRNGQNGIILDKVNNSKIFDNDCSFLSGWGLAMWRSCNNVVSRNAFDFCVRGYSHNVYNRGQDSAGILMFEQCNDNIIAENSLTHCGNGIYVHAGEEAIGKTNARAQESDYKRSGCNDNLFIFNDCSQNAVHGLECSFSFGSTIFGNRFINNGMCGIQGGYSQDSRIRRNVFEKNGLMPCGNERGGINLQSGANNNIESNTFTDDSCGVYIWTDFNSEIFQLPWAVANHKGAISNTVAYNLFENTKVGIHLNNTEKTQIHGNQFEHCGKKIWKQGKTAPNTEATKQEPRFPTPVYPCYGVTSPVNGRLNLDDRQHIIMTEWGPYDHEGVAVIPTRITAGEKTWIGIYGMKGTYKTTNIQGDVKVNNTSGRLPGVIEIIAPGKGFYPFSMDVTANDEAFQVKGTMVNVGWDVKFFQWKPEQDPRIKAEAWENLIAGAPLAEVTDLPELRIRCESGAPDARVPHNYFGTLATAKLDLPAGTYTIRALSDDGIRVWIDGELVIDNWNHHPITEDIATIKLAKGTHDFRVEHFEIEGIARLEVTIEP